MENLGKIWRTLKDARASQREAIIKNLDAKTIDALRSYANPYKRPIVEGNRFRYLAFNAINMTERYCMRFAMTSLIGFVYRMLDEYQPASSEKFISENDPRFADLYNQKIRDLLTAKPKEKLLAELREIKHRLKAGESDPELVRESFVIRAKLLKYQLYLLRHDEERIGRRHEKADREVREYSAAIQRLNEEAEILEHKIPQKAEYDQRRIGKADTDIADLTETAKKLDKKFVLTAQDARSRALGSLQKELSNKRETSAKLSSELETKSSAAAELGLAVAELQNKIAEHKKRLGELVREYKSKGGSAATIEQVEIDKCDPTEDELNTFATEVKTQLGIEKTAEEHAEETQEIVRAFLDHYFRFNPDQHVRCAYKPNYDDPSRTPLKKNEAEPEKNCLPPADTFFRWDRYKENNYEFLRQATDDIYCEKSDFEFDIVPLEVFEGSSETEALEAFDKYKRKYANEFEMDVFCAKFANHNLLSPWYQNRAIRDFYTEKTEIIKRIIDQNKEDASIGRDLVKKRAKKAGTETADHRKYRAANPPRELEKHGAEHVDNIKSGEIIQTAEIPRDTDELGDQELEVAVHVIKPKTSGSRRVRGFSEQWKFNITADKFDPNSVSIQTPAQFQQKLLQQENQV